MNTPSQAPPSAFFSISLHSLRVETILPFHLYLKHVSTGQVVLYRHPETSFTSDILEKLRESEVQQLYVPRVERDEYFEYISREIKAVVRDAKVEPEKKARVVYDTTSSIMEDLFSTPRSSRRILQAKVTIHYAVDLILQDEKAARRLLFFTNHDYYTYTHSVNVSLFATSLAQRIFGSSSEHNLRMMAEGFLLHDIGKSAIPISIINSPNKLNETEWALMRRHPELGLAILRDTRQNNDVIEAIVMEHHERMDGCGYPFGLKGTSIHPYGRICAIADVFDAITTVRSYREPLSTYDALKVMRDDMGNHFDWTFFDQFVTLFKQEDPRTAEPI